MADYSHDAGIENGLRPQRHRNFVGKRAPRPAILDNRIAKNVFAE
jgi:hypothetical protein